MTARPREKEKGEKKGEKSRRRLLQNRTDCDSIIFNFALDMGRGCGVSLFISRRGGERPAGPER